MRTLALAITVVWCGCSGQPAPPPLVPSTQLLSAPGPSVDAQKLVAEAPFTVLVFFSHECHCLTEHEGRLRDLYAAYRPRGVAFAMIDSEVGSTPESDAAEAAKRHYPFPIFLDRGAHLADVLDAQYATYTVIVNAEGRVLYRGGIDSDKTHLRDSAIPYVRDALDDLLAGRPPRRSIAKTLGCSLQKW